MIVGPALILLNKHILHSLSFPYPMFLSGLGILFSGISAQIIVLFGFVRIQKREAIEGVNWYKRILPIGMCYAGTLACGNTAYLLLDVGFIQMLKSFVPVIIMITLYIAGIEYPTKPVVIAVLIICIGNNNSYNVATIPALTTVYPCAYHNCILYFLYMYLYIGTAATCSYVPNANILGMLIMLVAEIFESIRLVMTQFLLQNLKFGVIEGMFHILYIHTVYCIVLCYIVLYVLHS